MDEWLNIVIRQLILYSLPLLISLTLVAMLEAGVMKTDTPHPFYAISWRGCWIPFLSALCFHRGVIISLSNPPTQGLKAAATRMAAHGLLCAIGFLLYAWSLASQAPTGLPPLHLWWAKVLMFFNLCMFFLHLLPLPLLLLGEGIAKYPIIPSLPTVSSLTWGCLTLLVATPLLDLSLGSFIIYPVYEWLSSLAIQLSG